MVARGLVDIDIEGYGGLRLNDSCRPLLKGEVSLELRRDLKPQTTAKSSSTSQASQLVRGEEREQWEALRTLRRKLAQEHSVPPYVIFPDSTLLEMLREQPTTMAEMARVSGVGARKLERYGQAFLEVLGGQAEAPKEIADIRHELISLARAGMTPIQIAGQLQCSEKTCTPCSPKPSASSNCPWSRPLIYLRICSVKSRTRFSMEKANCQLSPKLRRCLPGVFRKAFLYCVRAALQSEFEI